MASTNQIIKSRYLAERSYLYYQYPQASNERSIEFYLPMLENIEITESQRPNLATYDLIGRSGNLYSYLGAKSREFTLRFNITLPNILDYITNVGLNQQFKNSFRYFYNERTNNVRQFLKYSGRNEQLKVGDVNYYQKAKSKLASFNPNLNGATETNFMQNFVKFFKDLGVLNQNYSKNTNPTLQEAVNYLILWTNILRTSTINKSTDTSLGPPMIYINHGTMYNNIPCICTGFNISIRTAAGYDLTSFTPRQIEVSLNLSENRTGNFKNFKPFVYGESLDVYEGENLAGWEAVIEYGTMDPNNATFGEDNLDATEVARIEAAEQDIIIRDTRDTEAYLRYGNTLA